MVALEFVFLEHDGWELGFRLLSFFSYRCAATGIHCVYFLENDSDPEETSLLSDISYLYKITTWSHLQSPALT